MFSKITNNALKKYFFNAIMPLKFIQIVLIGKSEVRVKRRFNSQQFKHFKSSLNKSILTKLIIIKKHNTELKQTR